MLELRRGNGIHGTYGKLSPLGDPYCHIDVLIKYLNKGNAVVLRRYRNIIGELNDFRKGIKVLIETHEILFMFL